MNKAKIDWCDYTWNPVTGCLYGCDYCYASKIANRFALKEWQCGNCIVAPCCDGMIDTDTCGGISHYTPYEHIHELDYPKRTFYPKKKIEPYPFGFEPTFHKYRLEEPLTKTKGSKIFVCSMADLFGEWVPDEWIKQIIETCNNTPQHTYLFLTKNPKRYLDYFENDFDCNIWFGITADTKERLEEAIEIAGEAPSGANLFLSIEPLLEELEEVIDRSIEYFNWVIIGAQTGLKALNPEAEWVEDIVRWCKLARVPVFMKESLRDLMGTEFIQEWPEGLKYE